MVRFLPLSYLLIELDFTSFLLLLLSLSLDHTPGTLDINKEVVIGQLHMTTSSAKLETSYRP